MNKYVKRLYDEWVKHGKIIIGVDYDDTISPWSLNTQEECDEVLKELILAKNTGAYIAIFTACDPSRYPDIVSYCDSKGLKTDSINENPIQLPYGNHSKIYANIFIDDRAGINEALTILQLARQNFFNDRIALKEGDTEF